MRVPILDVRRQNGPIEAELRAAMERVLSSGHFILGPEVEAFEAAAARIAGTRFAIGMSSGTDALLVALMALDIGPGSEVICPSFTFFATAGCIARVGARPVFADCSPDSFNVEAHLIEPLITKSTKAIIPVHLFGQMADMDPILDLARRQGLRVIEDAAQAFGAEYRNRPAGSLGDFGIFSFYPTKNLGAFGDAGLLVTNDPALAAKARLLRNHGAEEVYIHRMVGGNFRLDAIQAALLMVKLPYLQEYSAGRQRNACEYSARFASLPGVRVPEVLPERTHIMNQYTIRVEGGCRDRLREFLEQRGIGSAIYYPKPLHLQECFAAHGPYRRLPVTEALAGEVLSLPVFAELQAPERNSVAAAAAAFWS